MAPLEIILAAIGMALSVYAFRVQQNRKRHPGYKPLCDISDRVSCTKAFESQHAALFFAPNSLWGMFYYFFLIIFFEYGWTAWALGLSSIGLIISLYLSYILYFRHKNFCLVCWATHAVNVLLFIFTVRLYIGGAA